jgi:hypothetical protein
MSEELDERRSMDEEKWAGVGPEQENKKTERKEEDPRDGKEETG